MVMRPRGSAWPNSQPPVSWVPAERMASWRRSRTASGRTTTVQRVVIAGALTTDAPGGTGSRETHDEPLPPNPVARGVYGSGHFGIGGRGRSSVPPAGLRVGGAARVVA